MNVIFNLLLVFSLFLMGERRLAMFVREPAVAGTFYPYDSQELKSVIKGFMDNVPETDPELDSGDCKIKGLICPHAGYSFSGQTAAYAFSRLKGRKYKTVVVIGPSHHAYFEGISVQPGGHFRTPLGDVEIDREFSRKLYESLDFVEYVDTADAPEHSVEVEIPFLQYILKDFKLVPILMGNQSADIVKKLASALVSLSNDDILLVASSDLYHGNDYSECVDKVNAATGLIKKFDVEEFYTLATTERDIACGFGPITTVMLACQGLGATGIKLTHLTNSSDVTGIKSPDRYVVGYSSFIIYEAKMSLSLDDKEELIGVAKRSIENAAEGRPLPEVETSSPVLKEKRGAFVTIKRSGHLRGCIGYIHAVKPLYETVNEMARQAAIDDPRFLPLSEEELPEIDIEISVLSPLKKIGNIDDIEVGRHGLYIIKGAYRGLLLPQVATENGWDRDTFLRQVSLKAGLEEDAWRDSEIYIFEAEVFGEK